jgi:hypothetical protein
MRAIALGIALTSGVGLAGCIDNNSGEVKKSNHQEIADVLKKDCPPGRNPVLYEVYTARPSESKYEIMQEAQTGKLPKKLTGMIVECEPDSKLSAK